MNDNYLKHIWQGSLALLCSVFLPIVFFLSGCGISSQLKQTNVELHNAVDSFDRAIDALARQSSDWQVVLQTLEENLVDDTQSTLRVELNDLMRTGLLATGGEFRCDADFLRIRMERELRRIRNDFVRILNTGEPLLPEIPIEPHICSTVPVAVDLGVDEKRRAILDVYGFDLRSMAITAEVVSVNGVRRNVTGSLGIISDQQMVLDLTKSGALPEKGSRQIVFSWNGKPQSVIPILNPTIEIRCTTHTELVTGDPETFTPPHKKGDKEFDDHGPCVRFGLNLKLDAERKKLWAEYRMDAWECPDDFCCEKKDFTQAEGSGSVLLFQVTSPNESILGFNLESNFYDEYIDNNHQSDIRTFGGVKPVEKLIYVGDTDGDEAGTETKVEIYFREMEVKVEKCETNLK